MRSMSILICGAAIVAVGLLSQLGADDQKQLAWDQVNGSTKIIGALGKPLGMFMRIDGKAREGDMSITNPLEVDAIDGKKLEKSVLVSMRGEDLRPGVVYHFRGYESGAMNSAPKDPESHGVGPQQPYRFCVWFEIVRTIDK